MNLVLAESPFLTSIYGIISGWLCFLVAIYFAFRRPSANVFISLPFVGMGGVELIGGYRYGRLSILLGILTILAVVLDRPRKAAVPIMVFAQSKYRWFVLVCIAIGVKIVVETLVFGLDKSRQLNLEIGLVSLLYPCLLVTLSEVKRGAESTARDLLTGMWTFPSLMMAGYLPFAFETGDLGSASNGESRLTIGTADTINSAQVLVFGAIGALAMAIKPKRKGTAGVGRVVGTALAAGFSVLVILTGTRQHLLACVVFIVFVAFTLQKTTFWRWTGSTIVAVALGIFAYEFTDRQQLIIRERFTSVAFQAEVSEGRGKIWLEAAKSALQNPLIGTGFKNFGEEFESGPAAGGGTVLRDSAHGVIQDVFSEHGIPLGIGFLLGCIQIVAASGRTALSEGQITSDRVLVLALIALLIPLGFSGVFLNAMPIYMLAIVTISRTPKRATAIGGPPHLRQYVRPPLTFEAETLRGGRTQSGSFTATRPPPFPPPRSKAKYSG